MVNLPRKHRFCKELKPDNSHFCEKTGEFETSSTHLSRLIHVKNVMLYSTILIHLIRNAVAVSQSSFEASKKPCLL